MMARPRTATNQSRLCDVIRRSRRVSQNAIHPCPQRDRGGAYSRSGGSQNEIGNIVQRKTQWDCASGWERRGQRAGTNHLPVPVIADFRPRYETARQTSDPIPYLPTRTALTAPQPDWPSGDLMDMKLRPA
jgi:hypothetical protein